MHAGRRRDERGLSLEQMQDVVRQPQRIERHRRGEHGGFVYEFTRVTAGERLTVIAEVKQQQCWLITGWVETNEN